MTSTALDFLTKIFLLVMFAKKGSAFAKCADHEFKKNRL